MIRLFKKGKKTNPCLKKFILTSNIKCKWMPFYFKDENSNIQCIKDAAWWTLMLVFFCLLLSNSSEVGGVHKLFYTDNF